MDDDIRRIRENNLQNEFMSMRYFPANTPRLKHAALHHFSKELRADVEAALEKPGGGLYLWGDTGVGKSYLAAAISHYVWSKWVKKGKGGEVLRYDSHPEFINVQELLEKMKNDITDPEQSEPWWESTFERLKAKDALVVLDDIAAGKVTEWEEKMLYLIVNARHENFFPTIYTSNLSLEALDTVLNRRITSRIRGSSKIIGMDGVDRRSQEMHNNL